MIQDNSILTEDELRVIYEMLLGKTPAMSPQYFKRIADKIVKNPIVEALEQYPKLQKLYNEKYSELELAINDNFKLQETITKDAVEIQDLEDQIESTRCSDCGVILGNHLLSCKSQNLKQEIKKIIDDEKGYYSTSEVVERLEKLIL